VYAVPNFVHVLSDVSSFVLKVFLLCKLLYKFREGLQVLNSFLLNESSGVFSDLDYSWIVRSSLTASRGRESADTRYLTTHSGGSWFTP